MLRMLHECVGLSDSASVIHMIVTKVANNLRWWAEDEEVLSRSLALLLELSTGFASGKLMLTLDTVRFLLRHHTEEHLPFLGLPQHARHRTTLHATLARLVFSRYLGVEYTSRNS